MPGQYLISGKSGHESQGQCSHSLIDAQALPNHHAPPIFISMRRALEGFKKQDNIRFQPTVDMPTILGSDKHQHPNGILELFSDPPEALLSTGVNPMAIGLGLSSFSLGSGSLINAWAGGGTGSNFLTMAAATENALLPPARDKRQWSEIMMGGPADGSGQRLGDTEARTHEPLPGNVGSTHKMCASGNAEISLGRSGMLCGLLNCKCLLIGRG